MADTLVWFAADGTPTDLTCNNKLADGISGRFAPPAVYSEVVVPDRPGAVLMNVRHDTREVDVPFIVQVDCSAPGSPGFPSDSNYPGPWNYPGLNVTPGVALRSAVRTLARTLDPARGDGYLLSTAPDGVQRKLVCQCVAGPQMTEQHGTTQLPRMLAFMLIFRARDPYWYDLSAHTVTYALGASTVFFPIFPLVLSPSTLHSTTPVTVDSDVEVWPVWVCTGPFIGVRFELGGSLLRLSYAAAAGEVVTIDTRPGVKTVVSSTVGNIFTSLDSTQMFPLEPGANALDVQIIGGTAAVSKVVLTYYARWLAP